MSARPVVPRLDPEDLDLLISRSLDGDLAAEDEQKLQQILAADPDAARRRDELASLVAALKALPNHEPPFAIATRVNVQVADRVKGLGSMWHRFGLYPPPALVGAAIAVLVGLGLASAFFTSPRTVEVASAPARKPKAGPVEVFFQSESKDAPAAAPAPAPEPKTRIAESHANQFRREAPALGPGAASNETRGLDRETDRQRSGKVESAEKDLAKNDRRTDQLEVAVSAQAAGAPAAPAPASALADASVAPSSGMKESAAREEEARTVDKSAVDKKQVTAKLKAAEVGRDEGTAGGAVAQAPAAGRAGALRYSEPASKPRWSISIVGPAQIGASWRLKKTPTTAPPDKPVTVVYRLTLDRTGRVLSARRDSGPVPAEVDEMVRGLLFEPAGEAGENREVQVEITAK